MSQPEITFRHGACNAAVFQNKYNLGDAGFLVKTVSFQGSYRDKEGEWQTTNSLKVNDIPKAILVLNKAYEYLTSNSQVDVEEKVEV